MESSASQREVCLIDNNNPEGHHSGTVVSTPHSKRVGFHSMTVPFCLKIFLPVFTWVQSRYVDFLPHPYIWGYINWGFEIAHRCAHRMCVCVVVCLCMSALRWTGVQGVPCLYPVLAGIASSTPATLFRNKAVEDKWKMMSERNQNWTSCCPTGAGYENYTIRQFLLITFLVVSKTGFNRFTTSVVLKGSI